MSANYLHYFLFKKNITQISLGNGMQLPNLT